MAFLMSDSFDDYATAQLTGMWTSQGAGSSGAAISAGNGRRSTQSLRLTGVVSSTGKPLLVMPANRGPAPSGATCVIGFAFRTNTFSGFTVGTAFDPASASSQSNFLALIREGGTTQVAFRLNADGTISAYRGQSSATLLGTSSSGLNANAYHYLEFKVVIDNGAGTVTVKRDGTTILSLTGQDTQQTASATWNEIAVLRHDSSTVIWDLDDFYLLDGTTTADDPRNDLLGDSIVEVIRPNANGTYNDSTPSGGAVDRYTMVDETLVDSDTTYNTFATAAQKDSYNYGAPVVTGTYHAVQVKQWMRKEDAGAATGRATTRLGGADFTGTTYAPDTTYGCFRQCWAQKPSDSADWTDGTVGPAEFGHEKVS